MWLQLLAQRGINKKTVFLKTFNRLYRAVLRPQNKKTLLGSLQQEFINNNLSLSLLLEPLDGFEWLSKKLYPLEFSSSSPIILQIISPVARLIGTLNNQHPPFYQPFINLLFVYLSLYLLNMPELSSMFEKSGIKTDRKKIKQTLPLILEESRQILPVTIGLCFKVKIAFYLGLGKRLLEKRAKHSKNNINFLDYVNAFLYGLWYMITTKGSSRNLKQI